MKPRARQTTSRILGLVLFLSLTAVAAADSSPEIGWSLTPNPGLATPSTPRLPAPPAGLPIQLILDDDGAESGFGIAAGATAKQFLWFNGFPSVEPFLLEEIWVLFSPGANMSFGNAVQLAVYHDPDSDPTNGATLLATYDVTISVLDGITFSVYPLPAPLAVPGGGDVLIGVVSRFVVSNVTSSTNPAAIDTTASQGRSWVAVWTGDPPDPPALPPDLLLDQVDVFVGGNWMIRGFGTPLRSVVEVPALGAGGLALLSALLGAAGAALARRRRR